ncbi:MAG: hypothetical protein PHC85_00605 [Candidatus Pacebacteria bacterium]|nr:hypothetical protein [Candidatus Paceibacterota bacterium]
MKKAIMVTLIMAVAAVVTISTIGIGFAQDRGPVGAAAPMPTTPVEFLFYLYNLPDNPRAVNSVQNESLKLRAAKTLIFSYSLARKGLQSGHVDRQKLQEALDEINAASGFFADKQFGNGNGVCEPEEMNLFNQAIPKNPGLTALMQLMASGAR